MADTAYDNVEVSVKRRDDQGMYEIGVVINGAFIPFAPVKIGHFDELIERERARAASEPQPEPEPARDDQQREPGTSEY